MLVRHVRRTAIVQMLAVFMPLVLQSVAPPRLGAQQETVAPVAKVHATFDGELVAAVERAARGASRRLEDRACASVLDEFADKDGRTLTEVASALALSPAEALGRVIFRDGRESPMCRTVKPAAFTGPGSRVVFVCPSTFLALDRQAAELVVVHELLHTLGLGERPPSSRDIDRAVARRCA